ncbi:unnamed protein product [Allacma fusca]|uniref:Uncharacterized protein n=1 Tax=Allacma fusca TaxID=39272 RepID=A0A8J2LEK1_9HEXA|nr:unnamed protein product [Allacma fusca]
MSVEISPPVSGNTSEQPSVSGMEGDEDFSSSREVGRFENIDWEALSVLNGRNDFVIFHDIGSCFRCWSPSSYYNIMGEDEELIMNGKRMCSLPGCKPRNIYIKDLDSSTAFYLKFITCGCFPVLKRIEIRDRRRQRIGIVAEVSKVVSMASYRIRNELEGVTFHVRSKLNLFKGHDYEIKASDGNLLVGTVDRNGPAHILKIRESNVVTSCNKALFISFCIFLDVRRRYCTT